MDLVNGNTFTLVFLYKSCKVVCIGLQVLRLPNQFAPVVHRRIFHPCRRAPRGGKQLQIWCIRLCFLDVGNQAFLITVNREMLQGIITGRFIKTVPIHRIIVCTDWHTTKVQFAGFAIRSKQFFQQTVLLIFGKRFEGFVALLIKASAKTKHFLIFSAIQAKICFSFYGDGCSRLPN